MIIKRLLLLGSAIFTLLFQKHLLAIGKGSERAQMNRGNYASDAARKADEALKEFGNAIQGLKSKLDSSSIPNKQILEEFKKILLKAQSNLGEIEKYPTLYSERNQQLQELEKKRDEMLGHIIKTLEARYNKNPKELNLSNTVNNWIQIAEPGSSQYQRLEDLKKKLSKIQ